MHFALLFLEQPLEFRRQVVETSLPVIVGLLQSSDMVAPLSKGVVAPDCAAARITLLPVRLDLPHGPAGIVRRRGVALSPGAHAMLRALREAVEGWGQASGSATPTERCADRTTCLS